MASVDCVCVAGADGVVRACGRAYARCEERWKVRMESQEMPETAENKEKPAAVNECSGFELTVETATSSMRTKRSTN